MILSHKKRWVRVLAAIPAAFAGSLLFAHMLDAASRITV
jgi:hypothetical protein